MKNFTGPLLILTYLLVCRATLYSQPLKNTKGSLSKILTNFEKNHSRFLTLRYTLKAAHKMRAAAVTRSPGYELEWEQEDIPLAGDYRDSIGKAIYKKSREHPTKRKNRISIQDLKIKQIIFQYEQERISLLNEIRSDLNLIFFARQRKILFEKFMDEALKIRKVAMRKMQAGIVTGIDFSKMDLEASKWQKEIEIYKKQVKFYQKSFSSIYEITDQFLQTIPWHCPEPRKIKHETLGEQIAHHPAILEKNITKGINILYARRAQLKTIKEYSWSVGAGANLKGKDPQIQFGISFPFEKQQPFKAEKEAYEWYARAITHQKLNQIKNKRIKLQNALFNTELNFKKWVDLKNELIPGAQKLNRLAIAGYKAGTLTLLDLLETRKSLVDLEIEAIIAWKDWTINITKIFSLIGPFKEDPQGEYILLPPSPYVNQWITGEHIK
ncbi:TolC family protein [Candidatus Riflebacteria bacterium]